MNHSNPNFQDDFRQTIAGMMITKGVDVTGAIPATQDATVDPNAAVTKQEPFEAPAKKRRVDALHSFIKAADITQEIAQRVPLLSLNGEKAS